MPRLHRTLALIGSWELRARLEHHLRFVQGSTHAMLFLTFKEQYHFTTMAGGCQVFFLFFSFHYIINHTSEGDKAEGCKQNNDV